LLESWYKNFFSQGQGYGSGLTTIGSGSTMSLNLDPIRNPMPWIRNPDSQSVHKVIEYGSNPDPQPWSRIRIQSI
jgi:hypothetical protein